MGAITKDGVYRTKDQYGDQFQFRKGHVLSDAQEANLEYVGPFPDLAAEAKADPTAVDAKAEPAPENKAILSTPAVKANR